MRIALSAIVLCLIVAVGCTPADNAGMSQPDEATDIAAVEAVLTAELSTLVAGDVAGNVALLTDDAILMPPDGRAYKRHEAEAMFTHLLEEFGISAAEYVAHDIEIHGDVAIDYYEGELTMNPVDGGAPMLALMKGIHILKRQADGSWKISHDVWNANTSEGM